MVRLRYILLCGSLRRHSHLPVSARSYALNAFVSVSRLEYIPYWKRRLTEGLKWMVGGFISAFEVYLDLAQDAG